MTWVPSDEFVQDAFREVESDTNRHISADEQILVWGVMRAVNKQIESGELVPKSWLDQAHNFTTGEPANLYRIVEPAQPNDGGE